MSYSSGHILLSSQREGQVSRFPAWVVIAVPLAAILFQVYIPLFFQFLGYLEMPLLVVVYFALMRRNPVAGLLIGSAVGLVQDSLSKNPLGMFGIVKTLVGYFASSIGVRLDVDNVVMRLLLAYFFFVFHQFFYWVLARALLRQQLAFEVERTLVVGLLNALVGIALYHFLDKLRESS
ncbi:MAG: rod shape-determining protein MreD [Bryobacteraceae bacterium]|jgi:rod shape-determining protein MreD